MAHMGSKASRDKSKYSWDFYIQGKKDWKSFESNMVLEKDAALYKEITGKNTTAVQKAGSKIIFILIGGTAGALLLTHELVELVHGGGSCLGDVG